MKLDTDKLSVEAKKRVERALSKPDTVVSRRFPAASVSIWRIAAKRENLDLTKWIKRHLDEAAKEHE